MTEFFQVMTTTDSADAADRLAAVLVEARLAACVQTIGPIRSRYWWEGKVETADEWLLIAKTTGARLDAVIESIQTNHAYDVPEVTATPITAGSEAYLAWLAASTSNLG